MRGTIAPDSHLYTGKELDRQNGADTYDYHARTQLSSLGQFLQVDPKCEMDYSISPYVFCAGNPIRYIDEDGMVVIDRQIMRDYPRLNKFLNGLLHTYNVKNRIFKTSFKRYSSLTDRQIKRTLTSGKGPLVKVGRGYDDNGSTEYHKRKLQNERVLYVNGRAVKNTPYGRVRYDYVNANNGNGLIYINKNVANLLERAESKDEIGKALLLIESTLFHEFTHFGNLLNNHSMNGKYVESGKEFEKNAYGSDVDPSNINEVYEKLNQE